MNETPFNNYELELAYQFIQYTNDNLFLTGNAGTGKTTFLHNLRLICKKKMIVLAPTGVAAINANGETIHSFFQLPFTPFIPKQEKQINQLDNNYESVNNYENIDNYKFNKNKIKLIRALELLVIDEISMVRSDILDAIDIILKHYRNSDKPFGGVQLLMIGDLHQLTPIIKDIDKKILEKYYESPYFFDSVALKKTVLKVIELKHIYRQSDLTFIKILNEIRNNVISKESLKVLNERYYDNLPNEYNEEKYITLTVYNKIADNINTTKLKELPEKQEGSVIKKFEAVIKDIFPQNIYPNNNILYLAKGAQVMFIKNDTSFEKSYYNGKIGVIFDIREDEIDVICNNELEQNKKIITVRPVIWNNVKYSINEETNEIEEIIIGTFEQYPLKLAWAITIHKSQGLTFEKAIIDAGHSFTAGQVYVALSRCRNLNGFILTSKIESKTIKPTPKEILNFEKNTKHPDTQSLQQSKIFYRNELIFELFDFYKIEDTFKKIYNIYNQNINYFDNDYLKVLEKINSSMKKNITNTSTIFKNKLARILQKNIEEYNDCFLQDRIKKACNYYVQQIQNIFIDNLQDAIFICENTKIDEKISNLLRNLELLLLQKINTLQISSDGFDILKYIRTLNDTENKFISKFNKSKYKSYNSIENYELYYNLIQWRIQKAKEENKRYLYSIFPNKALKEISKNLPNNKEQLLKINGIGRNKIEKYGNDVLEIVENYCEKYSIHRNEFLY